MVINRENFMWILDYKINLHLIFYGKIVKWKEPFTIFLKWNFLIPGFVKKSRRDKNKKQISFWL